MPNIYKSWRDYPMSEWRWPNFSPQEIACRGTGRLMVVPEAMDKLQALRDRMGAPLIVNSAYRSPEHNRAVGGAKASKHMDGIAFDVKMDNHDPDEYITAALAVGFDAIGTYPRQNFVHVDDRGYRVNWGKPFPKRKVTPKFPVEEKRPQTNPLKDGQVQGIGGGILGTVSTAPAVLEGVSKLDPIAQYAAIGGVAIVGVVLAGLLVKRVLWLKQ